MVDPAGPIANVLNLISSTRKRRSRGLISKKSRVPWVASPGATMRVPPAMSRRNSMSVWGRNRWEPSKGRALSANHTGIGSGGRVVSGSCGTVPTAASSWHPWVSIRMTAIQSGRVKARGRFLGSNPGTVVSLLRFPSRTRAVCQLRVQRRKPGTRGSPRTSAENGAAGPR